MVKVKKIRTANGADRLSIRGKELIGKARPCGIRQEKNKPRGTITLPRIEYEALLARLEDLEDARAIEEACADPDRERLPAEMVRRLLLGRESKVRIWREHRGLAAGELARRADVAPTYLSEIETGKKPGSTKAMAGLARALNVNMEDLL